jgi:type II secretory pathway predicted ATPase ExeA
MPFKVQEIQDKGGIYFGENAISHNLIMCNKANLLNQSAFLLGVPGSGKSFSAKELIAFLMLNTDDDILICDPRASLPRWWRLWAATSAQSSAWPQAAKTV